MRFFLFFAIVSVSVGASLGDVSGSDLSEKMDVQEVAFIACADALETATNSNYDSPTSVAGNKVFAFSSASLISVQVELGRDFVLTPIFQRVRDSSVSDTDELYPSICLEAATNGDKFDNVGKIFWWIHFHTSIPFFPKCVCLLQISKPVFE